jgi:hypothetical protein
MLGNVEGSKLTEIGVIPGSVCVTVIVGICVGNIEGLTDETNMNAIDKLSFGDVFVTSSEDKLLNVSLFEKDPQKSEHAENE